MTILSIARGHARHRPAASWIRRSQPRAIIAATLLAVCFTTAAAQVICNGCGRTIWGQHLKHDHRPYCSWRCLKQRLPHCQRCREPQREWIDIDGHRFCRRCGALPACSSCRLPGASLRLTDGRLLCPACSARAVFDPEAARHICRMARRDIGDRLGLRTGHSIGCRLVDADSLAAVAGRPGLGSSGVYDFQATYREGDDSLLPLSLSADIYLLAGLPPEELWGAAAHELGHDIFQERYPHIGDNGLKEGFAEYVAAVMNGYWRRPELNRTDGRRDTLAARRLRRMLELDRAGGSAAVLDSMAARERAAADSAKGRPE